jgi:hypothetical protein
MFSHVKAGQPLAASPVIFHVPSLIRPTADLDLFATAVEGTAGINLVVCYNCRLLAPVTAQQLTHLFALAVESIARAIDTQVTGTSERSIVPQTHLTYTDR